MPTTTPDVPPTRTPLISPGQIVAGAAAAVTSAVVGSLFGTAGTLVGAALASVVSTVAAALYSRSLTVVSHGVRTVAVRPQALSARVARLPWRLVLGGAGIVFLLTMVVLTATEALANRPVSAITTGRAATGTTWQHVSQGNIGEPTTATSTPAASTPATTPSGSAGATGSAAPSGDGSATSTATGSATSATGSAASGEGDASPSSAPTGTSPGSGASATSGGAGEPSAASTASGR